jgi:hypothetical protein
VSLDHQRSELAQQYLESLDPDWHFRLWLNEVCPRCLKDHDTYFSMAKCLYPRAAVYAPSEDDEGLTDEGTWVLVDLHGNRMGDLMVFLSLHRSWEAAYERQDNAPRDGNCTGSHVSFFIMRLGDDLGCDVPNIPNVRAGTRQFENAPPWQRQTPPRPGVTRKRKEVKR